MAVAGLVLGILAVVFCWFPFLNWILAILGIIFGGLGISKANKGAPGKGMAIAGLVCGVVGFLVGTLIFILALQQVQKDRDRLRYYNSEATAIVPADRA
jgi:hypothetical protein